MKFLICAAAIVLLAQAVFGQTLPDAAAFPEINIGGGKTETRMPFELIDNRIFVNVIVNEQKELKFLFDSGASNMIVPEAARDLGLKASDKFEQGGAGAETVEAWRTKIAVIDIGDIRASNQTFNVFSLETIKKAVGFRRFDGIIGFEIFSRFVVKIDYEQSSLTFTEPDEFSYHGSGTQIPFEFYGRIPQIEAEIESIKGKFIVDTGDRSSLTLFVPFVEKNNLRVKFAPRLELITGWGVGGPIPAQVARRKSLKLGGDLPVRDFVIRLPTAKSGGFVRDDAAGSIGTGILKKFNVIFDYSRRRLIFEKNKNYDAFDWYDGSGMWLGQRDDIFEVMSVAPESPAAKAGIKTGDKIVAVNGKPAEQLFLPDVRRILFFTGRKTLIRLTIETDRKIRRLLLPLENLL